MTTGRFLPADLRPVPRRPTDTSVYVIEDGLWCLRLPLPYRAPTSVNCYLLALADGFCLIDCGTSLPPGWSALARALELAGVEPGAVRLLLCTHLHADHAGGAATVVEQTGCEFVRAIGPDTIDDVLRDPAIPVETRRRMGLHEGIPGVELDAWVDARLADDVHHDRISPERFLTEGDILATRLGRWRVVPAPGHSPTQVVLFNEPRRWLISADLAYGSPEPFLEYGHTPDPYGEHLAAIDRIRELNASLLLPGHGRAVNDPALRLGEARAAAVARSQRILAALSTQPRSAHALVLELVEGDPDHNRRQSMLSVTLCVLQHLETTGQAVSETGDDGVRRFRR